MNTDYSGGHISLGRHRKLKDSAQKHATRASVRRSIYPYTHAQRPARSPASYPHSNAICSGLMKPDAHLGENARHREVSDDQATPYLYPRIQM
jgi:hypothetical protein